MPRPGGLVLLLVLVAVAATGCAPRRPPPPGRSAPAPAALPPLPSPDAMPQQELGLLPVFITDQGRDGRTIRIRGVVGNPYPEPVDGVRVIVRVLLAPRPDAEEVDRLQQEYRVRIASGDRAPLRIDMRSAYAKGDGTGGIFLQAYAIRRGNRQLPLPPDWR